MTLCTELSPDLQSPLEQAPALGEIVFGQPHDRPTPGAEGDLVNCAFNRQGFGLFGPYHGNSTIKNVVEPLDGSVCGQVSIEELKGVHAESKPVSGQTVDNLGTDGAYDLLHGCCDQDLTEVIGPSSTVECCLDQGDRFVSIVGDALDNTQNSVEGVHLEQQIFDLCTGDLFCVGHGDLGILHASEKASRAVIECRFCVDGFATVELGFRA